MDLGMHGKKALVTGAARGIGRAIAIGLAREGAQVAICSRTESDLQSLLSEMGGGEAGHFMNTIDLLSLKAPEKLVNSLKENFGSPDIVVHNVGGTLDIKDPFCSLEDWRRVWRFNFEIAVELDQMLIPFMTEQKWGRVIHIASTASMENNGPITYCSAKAALMAYSRGLGRILAPTGVVLSAVLPGAVFTKGGYWDKTSVTDPEHVHKYVRERLPLKGFGMPEDVASMVVFLSSEQAKFCQGSIIPVEGGQSRHYFGQ